MTKTTKILVFIIAILAIGFSVVFYELIHESKPKVAGEVTVLGQMNKKTAASTGDQDAQSQPPATETNSTQQSAIEPEATENYAFGLSPRLNVNQEQSQDFDKAQVVLKESQKFAEDYFVSSNYKIDQTNPLTKSRIDAQEVSVESKQALMKWYQETITNLNNTSNISNADFFVIYMVGSSGEKYVDGVAVYWGPNLPHKIIYQPIASQYNITP
ncbi:hypothetical protein HGB13_01070 [bacterium]|nr:hypothetical protein [bacterium]